MDIAWITQALYGFALIVAGLLVSSLVGAIWLRLAAIWLGFATIPYRAAFKSSLITNFILISLNGYVSLSSVFSISLLGGLEDDRGYSRMNLAFSFPPLYFMYATIFGLLITAAVLMKTIPEKESNAGLKFVDSLALAAFYFALTFAFLVFVAVFVLLAIIGIFKVTGV